MINNSNVLFQYGNWSQLTLPVIDDFLSEDEQYLPLSPNEAFASGNYLKIPVLTGITANDGAVVTSNTCMIQLSLLFNIMHRHRNYRTVWHCRPMERHDPARIFKHEALLYKQHNPCSGYEIQLYAFDALQRDQNNPAMVLHRSHIEQRRHVTVQQNCRRKLNIDYWQFNH